MEDFLAEYRRVVLLGEPGAGKSTTLRRLTRLYAKYWQSKASPELPPNEQGHLPLYLQLNRWSDTSQNLVNFIKSELGSMLPERSSALTRGKLGMMSLAVAFPLYELMEALPELLQQGRVVLLLDGLNEIPALNRNPETDQLDDPRVTAIATFGQTYPQNACLLSCRVKDFRGGPDWQDLHLLNLTKEQIRAFAAACYEDKALADSLISNLYQPDNPQREKLQSLVVQPFYLRHLVTYFYYKAQELPANSVELLNFSLEAALEDEIKKGLLNPSQAKELKLQLGLLAFNMTDAGLVAGLDKPQASDWLYNLRPKKGQGKTSRKTVKPTPEIEARARVVWRQAEGTKLIIDSGKQVRFYHQLIQEFLTASYCQSLKLTPGWLERTVNSNFREIWRMWAGLNPGLVPQLLKWLEKNSEPALVINASVALGWIGDERAVGPLLKLLKKANEGYLGHQLIATIGRAMSRLGAAGLVGLLELLESEDKALGRKASEALAYEGLDRVANLVQLLKNEDENKRRLAAFGLGRYGYGQPAEVVSGLIQALKDSSSDVRWNAATSLVLAGDLSAMNELEKVVKEDKSLTSWGDRVGEAAENTVEQLKARLDRQIGT